jgi:hypothetical protein
MGGKLTQASTVSSGDWVVLWKTDQGDSRGVSFTDFTAALQSALSIGRPEADTQYSAPAATGFSVNISGIVANHDVHLILTPAAGYADGTLVLPLNTACRDKQEITVNCTQSVGALAITANGATSVVGAPSALSANDFFKLKFDLPTNNWYRVG